VALIAFSLLAGSAAGRDSYAPDGFFGAGSFGPQGPARMALYAATNSLYVIDFSATPKRLLKFDVSDPANPQPENFSALGTNAITQADNDPVIDTPLNLVQASNLAVDNSGGPQDGTIYVSTGTAAAARVEAFSSSGEWLYQLEANGIPVPSPVVAVSQSGANAGQIAALAYHPFFGGTPSSATFRPSPTPGQPPEPIRVSLPTGTAPGVAFFTRGGTEVHAFGGLSASGNATRVRRGPDALSQLSPTLTMANTELNFSVADIAPTAEDDVWLARTNHAATSDRSLALLEMNDENVVTVRDRFALGVPLGTGLLVLPDGLIYASDPAGRIQIYARASAPDVEMLDPTWNGADGATFRARVNPQSKTIDTCRFEASASQFFFGVTTYPCDGLPITASGEVVAQAPAAGLTNGTTYYFRLRLSASDGTAFASQLSSWQMPVIPNLPIQVETLKVGGQDAANSSAVLGGLMNPNGSPATYFVEYSTEPDLSGAKVYPPGKDAAAGSGTAQIRVNTVVPGLKPNTTYYYRLVAKTDAGEVPAVGSPQSFLTLPAQKAQPSSCPNARFRTGPSAQLPGCMAYERVTPAETNYAEPWPSSNVTNATGDTTIYGTTGAFAGGKSVGVIGQYRAVRDPETGWHNESIDPEVLAPGSDQGNFYGYDAVNPELTAAFGAPRNTVYGENKINWGGKLANLLTGNVLNLARLGFSEPDEGLRVVTNRNEDFAISADGSEAVYFDYRSILVDRGPQPPVTNATQPSMFWYSPAEGVRLASVDPAGNPLINTSTSSWTILLAPNGQYAVVAMQSSYTNSPEVYVLRKGATGSDWISRNRAVAPDQPPADPVAAATRTTMVGWSKDLRYLFLRSQTPLLPDSDADPGDLYVYDIQKDKFEVINLVEDSSVPVVMAVQASQGFGDHTFYFQSQGNLTPGATGGGFKVYGWRAGALRLVRNGNIDATNFQASPNGRYLAFRDKPSDTAIALNEKPQIYRYDWDRNVTDCVSCSPFGEGAVDDAFLDVDRLRFKGSGVSTSERFGERPHMLDDGSVLFNTRQRLVREDRDNAMDVYLWDGAPHLISSGTESSQEVSETTTPDGSSIFVYTTAQLVPADDDAKSDLYVAREGGGFAAQQVRPDHTESTCQTNCQGTGSNAPDRSDLRTRTAKSEPAPLAAVASRRPRATVRGGKVSRGQVARLRVRVSTTGRILVRGNGLLPSRRRVQAGQMTVVPVRLSPGAAKQLARRGSFRTRATVRLQAAAGGSVTKRVGVVFKRPARANRRATR
jgi:hypothetical protein